MAIGISPALPIDYDQLDGPYRLTKTIKQSKWYLSAKFQIYQKKSLSHDTK